MKTIYSLVFVITLMLTLGIISDVKAVHLSNQIGRITITRNVTVVHNPVTNTFSYAIEEDEENPVSVTGLPGSVNIVFNNTAPVIPTGKWTGTAVQTGTLDLTGINFTKVGDYAFNISETASTDPVSYPIADGRIYTVMVAVRNQLDGNNQPTGTLEATVAYVASGITKVPNIEFEATYIGQMMSITKEVQGNMANPDEYFKVLVDIDCPNNNTHRIYYHDVLTNSDNVDTTISYNGNNINRLPSYDTITGYYSTYTCGQTNYVYLKHGEEVMIVDFLNETEYSFTEQDATSYETYINKTSTNSKSSGTLIIEAPDPGGDSPKSNILGKEYKPKNMANEAPTVDYDEENGGNIILNVYNSEVPTGAIIKYLPYAILLLVVAGALTFFIIANKKIKKED